MFTGIIEGTGKVRSVSKVGSGKRLEIESSFALDTTNVGDSIAVNGCCLTVTSRLGKCFWVDISPDTILSSTLGRLRTSGVVNLERAMRLGGRLDGHLVQGHVDAVSEVVSIKKSSNSMRIKIYIPANFSKNIVEKGSVAVDGVSLTVQSMDKKTFEVTIIPHTSLTTTFSWLKVGSYVNLEVDIIGKYVEKLKFLDDNDLKEKSELTKEFLKQHGFE
ncbi:MAG: riboflavin synthase [Pseudomonadota bacterium]